MLALMGATDTVRNWEELRQRREVRATANRLVNFDDANLRRSAQAAVARARGSSAPWRSSARRSPSTLSTPASRARPPRREPRRARPPRRPALTKDAVAGRIRRLLAMADKRAAELGVPGTEANLPADLDDV